MSRLADIGIAHLGEDLPLLEGIRCRAVGLGASLTTMHVAFGKELDAWLGLPPNCPTCALLPIGWPRGSYGRPERRGVDGCLFYEHYDGGLASTPARRPTTDQ